MPAEPTPAPRRPTAVETESVRIEVGSVAIDADLRLPGRASGIVVFAHGSGSSRFSHRNRAVAAALEHAGFGTLLLDLLTPEEEAFDARTAEHRFDIEFLGRRVVAAADWLQDRADLRPFPLVLFGASTGAAAALVAAAARPMVTRAVISRGGRPDLAKAVLSHVQTPTLLIVGSEDRQVVALNREAMRQMRATVQLEVVAGASHLFEEPGALEQVSALAVDWCRRHLAPRYHAVG